MLLKKLYINHLKSARKFYSLDVGLRWYPRKKLCKRRIIKWNSQFCEWDIKIEILY